MLKEKISKLKDKQEQIDIIETNLRQLELLLQPTDNSARNPESVSFKNEPPNVNMDSQPEYNTLSCQNQETYMHSEHFN